MLGPVRVASYGPIARGCQRARLPAWTITGVCSLTPVAGCTERAVAALTRNSWTNPDSPDASRPAPSGAVLGLRGVCTAGWLSARAAFGRVVVPSRVGCQVAPVPFRHGVFWTRRDRTENRAIERAYAATVIAVTGGWLAAAIARATFPSKACTISSGHAFFSHQGETIWRHNGAITRSVRADSRLVFCAQCGFQLLARLYVMPLSPSFDSDNSSLVDRVYPRHCAAQRPDWA